MSISYLVGRFASGLAPGTVPAPAPVNGYVTMRYSHLLQVNTSPGTLIPVTPVRLQIVNGVLVGPDGIPSTTKPIPVQATDDPQLAQSGEGVFAQLDIVFDGGSEPVQAMLALPGGAVVDIATAARAGTGGAVFVSGLTPSQLDELGAGLAATEAARDAALVTLSQAQAAAAAAEEAAEGAAAPTDAAIATLLGTSGSATRAALDAIESQPGFDIIPLLGQSNMVGRGLGVDPVAFDATVGRIYSFGSTGVLANQVVLGSDPLMHWDPNGNVGPGMSFARSYVASRPVHRKVLLVPCAEGGTAFTTGDHRWKVGFTPEYRSLYAMAVRQIQLALAAAGPGVHRIAGFLWHQGEGDDASTYAANIDELIGALRTQFAVPMAWFVLGQMNPAGNALDSIKQATNLVHIDTPRRNQRTAFAYSKPLHNPDDTTHFSARGERDLGESMARAVPLAIANVTGRAPLPPTAVTSVLSTPGTLLVEWERPACRFTDFVVERRAVGTTPWTAWAHTASLHNQAAITGLVAGQAYEVRVATVNETGTSAWSPVVTLTASRDFQTTAGPVPWRMYGLRRLRSGYTGPCIRVRRSSDNTEQDIGFTPDGLLDEVALRAFVGINPNTSHGYIRTWYDQTSPITGHLACSVLAEQPQIVAGGKVLKENGRPVIAFDGVDDNLWSNVTGLSTMNGMTAVLALKEDGSIDSAPRLLAEGSTTSDQPFYALAATPATRTLFSPMRVDAGGAQATASSGIDYLTPGTLQAIAMSDDAASVSFSSGLRESGPIARSRPTGALTMNRFVLGLFMRTSYGNPAKMRVSELACWQMPLLDSDRRAVIANIRAHHVM